MPAQAATAAVRVIETSAVAESPKLAGDRILWTQARADSSFALWSLSRGGEMGRVQRFPMFDPVGSAGELLSQLAASPSLAVVTSYGLDSVGGRGFNTTFSEHWAGSPGGPLEQVTRCEDDDDADHGGLIRPADAWGEAYAYRECDESYGHVEIRDTASAPLSPARTVGTGGFGVRIAGRYVAWLEAPYTRVTGAETSVVVYDRVADSEVYRIPEGFGQIYNLDVQEDGKIAVAFDQPGDGGNAVGWASPAEPEIHPLPLAGRHPLDVRIAGDRIAFQGGDRSPAPGAGIAVTDLAGNVVPAADGTDAVGFGESFDYDGERLVWRELGCEKRRLVIAAVGEPERIAPRARSCRLRLLARPVVRRGVAAFRFDCGAFKPPCGFDVSLRLTGGQGTPAGKVFYRQNPVRVRLSRPARRLLRERGSIRVRARVRLIDAASRSQVRRRTIRLRAP